MMRVHHPGYQFAGTLDRVLRWAGREWIIDIKTGGKEAWHGLQTAGYEICFDPLNKGFWRRCCVHLTDAGRYGLQLHERQSDRDVFLGMVAAYHWKHEHGVNTHGHRND
jgi:hypothetical protein